MLNSCTFAFAPPTAPPGAQAAGATLYFVVYAVNAGGIATQPSAAIVITDKEYSNPGILPTRGERIGCVAPRAVGLCSAVVRVCFLAVVCRGACRRGPLRRAAGTHPVRWVLVCNAAPSRTSYADRSQAGVARTDGVLRHRASVRYTSLRPGPSTKVPIGAVVHVMCQNDDGVFAQETGSCSSSCVLGNAHPDNTAAAPPPHATPSTRHSSWALAVVRLLRLVEEPRVCFVQVHHAVRSCQWPEPQQPVATVRAQLSPARSAVSCSCRWPPLCFVLLPACLLACQPARTSHDVLTDATRNPDKWCQASFAALLSGSCIPGRCSWWGPCFKCVSTA